MKHGYSLYHRGMDNGLTVVYRRASEFVVGDSIIQSDGGRVRVARVAAVYQPYRDSSVIGLSLDDGTAGEHWHSHYLRIPPILPCDCYANPRN